MTLAGLSLIWRRYVDRQDGVADGKCTSSLGERAVWRRVFLVMRTQDENTKRGESRSPNGPFTICATCCRGTIAAGLWLLPSHERQAHRTVVLPRSRAVRVN